MVVSEIIHPSSAPRKPSQLSDSLGIQLDFVRVSRDSQAAQPHILFSPLHYESGYSYPLLVWLHGVGDDERQLLRVMPTISMRNYVAVAPQGIAVENQQKPHFDWPCTGNGVSATETRVFDCIELAKTKCNIANHKIYLVGFGTGGTMAIRLGLEYPDMFAGVLSLTGRFPQDRTIFRRWNQTKNLPFFISVGKDSTTFSPTDAANDLRLLHTAGLDVSVRQYSCGQELTPQMLQDVNRWIMEKVCHR